VSELENQYLDKVSEITRNYTRVKERVADAARVAGRCPDDIMIVSVTKTHPAGVVRAAISAGLREFGENYAQEAAAKVDEVGHDDNPSWHFIGHLQSNKTGLIVGRCSLIHCVDREKIAKALSVHAQMRGIIQDVLVQVVLGDKQSKTGAPVDQFFSLCELAQSLPGLRLRGLMGVAPIYEADGSVAEPRRHFDRLKALYDQLDAESYPVLSMGMSGDFEEAVASGATLVRIGSAIFGSRDYSAG
jgi:pyridoxal phosphate enzyme (YggS family)